MHCAGGFQQDRSQFNPKPFDYLARFERPPTQVRGGQPGGGVERLLSLFAEPPAAEKDIVQTLPGVLDLILRLHIEVVDCVFVALIFLEPDLFLTVTGLTIKDFHLLVRLKVFNTEQMNQAVFAFRRYEDASLRYTGIESHEGLSHYGLYDTVVAIER